MFLVFEMKVLCWLLCWVLTPTKAFCQVVQDCLRVMILVWKSPFSKNKWREKVVEQYIKIPTRKNCSCISWVLFLSYFMRKWMQMTGLFYLSLLILLGKGVLNSFCWPSALKCWGQLQITVWYTEYCWSVCLQTCPYYIRHILNMMYRTTLVHHF